MLWIGASLVVVTATSTGLAIEERRDTVSKTLQARLVEATGQQAIAVSDAVWKLNKEGAETVLRGMSRDPDFLAIHVTDEAGRLFASVGAKDVPATLVQKSIAPITVNDGGDERQIGTLVLYFSTSRLETMRRDLMWDATKLGLIQVAAVLLATALVLRALIKPLERITNRMLRLAEGDLTSSIPYKDRPDQLGDIARAVDLFRREMSARRQVTYQLELAQKDLERRIQERTRDLGESEKRFRSLFDNSPLPKWVYSTRSLRFLQVNNAAISKYGYSQEEFLSMTLMDIRPPEDVARLTQWLRQPAVRRHHATNWRHRQKDGLTYDVEVYMNDVEFGGEPARLAVVIDVTDRKKVERQIQRIVETSQDIILVTDGYGRFLLISPSSASVLGYLPEEMIGRLGSDFIWPEDLELTRDEMRAARHGSAVRHFRCRYVHRDGHPVPLVWNSVWSEPDRCHFFIGRDMTEYERTEQQLLQAQKMEAVGQLTGGVAHDFNNILMVIMAGIEALEDRDDLDDDMRTRITRITAAVERASSLTRQLLNFSRKRPLRPKSTNVNGLVSATCKLLERSLGEQIEIVTSLGKAVWTIEVDQAQLESALINLSINARDAMPSGGRLTIETRNVFLDDDYVRQNPDVTPGDYAMISVTDTGTGMPPDVLSKMFEPFFTTKPPGKGTGLGLSMVYGFIKQSGGHVRVYSEVGRGTSIELHFQRAPAHFGGEESSRRLPFRGAGERILVVENDTDVRESVVGQLRDLGYGATDAPDAVAGLRVLEGASPCFDLLLSDVIMPGPMDGPALAAEVRRRWPATRVIFMSGYTGNFVTTDAPLLNKPFHKSELAEMVHRTISACNAPS